MERFAGIGKWTRRTATDADLSSALPEELSPLRVSHSNDADPARAFQDVVDDSIRETTQLDSPCAPRERWGTLGILKDSVQGPLVTRPGTLARDLLVPSRISQPLP